MTKEEINSIKYFVCCPMCDNVKCVRNTDRCESWQWFCLKNAIKQKASCEAYEEYCVSKNNYSGGYRYPDNYTEVSHLCGKYGKEDIERFKVFTDLRLRKAQMEVEK